MPGGRALRRRRARRLAAPHRQGRPGASGVRIAVVDSGIAYRRLGRRYRRSPDFIKRQFAPGYDFVDRDKHPLDVFGHGTHVAGTIGERTNNGLYLTGLAYNAKIIPVRVLDSHGDGTASQVAKGIRFAADHNARVINMSFDFGTGLSGSQLPGVRDAIRYANGRGAILVASAGNNAKNRIPYPASGPKVISVGATTSHGCLASYSNRGTGSSSDKHLDIAAPGGGIDAAAGAPPCTGGSQPQIFQVTRNPQRRCCKRFAIVRHAGTSQAAPHVSAIAAMVLATGKVGGHPTPAQMLAHLVATGDPLPAPFDYVNLVDAAAATAP
jgi:serine protease